MQKVLFVCTHNSARSQMAEAALRAKYREFYQAFSAGTNPTKLNPYEKVHPKSVPEMFHFQLSHNYTHLL